MVGLNGNTAIAIRTDTREAPSGIPLILEKTYGIKTPMENLKTGDYVIGDGIVVERKTAADFVQSIIDGRLFKQAWMMKKYFDQSLVIITGDLSIVDNIHPHAIAGALISLTMAWQVPVLFAKDAQEAALLLWLMATQNIKPVSELSYRPGRHPKRPWKSQLYILQGLPCVGPKMALKLLDHFKSVAAVMSASEEELKQVRGLGQKKSCEIKKILSKGIVK